MNSSNPALFIAKSMLFFLDKDRKRYFIHMPIVLISETAELLPPFLLGLLVSMLMDYKPGQSLLSLALVIGALTCSRGLFAWVRLRSKRILGQVALNSRYRARVWGFERLVGFSMTWHHQESAGNKVQRLITGSEAVRDWGVFHNDIAGPLATLIGVMVSCFFISPWFILFGVYFMLGMGLIERHYDRKIAALSVHINKSAENASGTIVEGATNILTIKAAGAGAMVRSAVQGREANATALGHERVTFTTQKWLAFQAHTGIALGIYLTAIAWATIHGVVAVGFVITYVQYFNGLRTSTTTFTDRFQTMVERYSELMRLMPLFDDSQALKAQTRHTKFPTDWDGIKVSDLEYNWQTRTEGVQNTSKPALRGVSFSIARGERVGITGKSGSGKSTLIKLLLALYEPAAGRIEIGGISNLDIQPDEFERHVTVVLQDAELFNVSIKDNVTLMRELDEVLYAKACEAAGLTELIAALPQGGATQLGDRGYSLSGGERQRIGIARALYRQPSILILDEATSALDDATEDHVMSGILSCMPIDSVVIAIAHRTRSLKDMGRVLHFAEGQLVSDCRAEQAEEVS